MVIGIWYKIKARGFKNLEGGFRLSFLKQEQKIGDIASTSEGSVL